MHYPRILLIKGGYSASGVGEQFTETMLGAFPKNNITRFSLVKEDLNLNENLFGYITHVQKVPISTLPIVSTIKYWTFKWTVLNKCKSIVQSLIANNNFDLIWIILNNNPVIQLTFELLKEIEFPMVLQIWDDPDYQAGLMRLDPFTKKHMRKLFDKCAHGAKRSVTISDAMGRLYEKRYNLPFLSMVFSPHLSAFNNPLKYNADTNEVKIVFAGSLYAYKEWNAFIEAVARNNESQDNKRISVLCIGSVSRWAKKRDFIIYERLKPIAEAAKAINNADIAYLPYWMSRKYKNAVQTAFPSKLSLYIAAGTPVFYHGPSKSTPAEFLSTHEVGLSCHSMESKEILFTIRKLLDTSFQKNYSLARSSTIEKNFHPKRCVEKFEKTIELALKD